VATVGLLFWQREKDSAPKLLAPPIAGFDHCLHHLAHGDRLQQLIALRQLQQWQDNQLLSPMEQRDLPFYLQAFLEVTGDRQLQRLALNLLGQKQLRPEPLSIPQTQRERQVIE